MHTIASRYSRWGDLTQREMFTVTRREAPEVHRPRGVRRWRKRAEDMAR